MIVKKVCCLLFVFCLSVLMYGQQRYIFYLHGKIVEDQGANAVDTVRGFGAYQYENILAVFRKEAFVVISEIREKNTDVEVYALKIKEQVDSLIKKKVP